jgi:hypothetical protein
MPADRRLRRINAWVHREYVRLFERCLATRWPEWAGWPAALRHEVLGGVTTFVNGLTASWFSSPAEWPPGRLSAQLGRQLELWRAHATSEAGRGATARASVPARPRALRQPGA